MAEASFVNVASRIELDALINAEDNKLKEAKIFAVTFLGEELTNIPPKLFSLFDNLEEFVCFENRVTDIQEEIFTLTKLTKLNMHDNRISVVPPGIGNLVNLSKLFLYNNGEEGNSIVSLPSTIGNCKLSVVNISGNLLKTLPDEFFTETLTLLNVADNKIEEIPKGIKNAVSLTKLNIAQNKLKEIPQELSLLPKLKKLLISFNEITELKDYLGKEESLPSLQHLHLLKNKISVVEGLPWNLTYLSLSGNNLKEIPICIGNCKNLLEFDVCYNSVEKFTEDDLFRLPKTLKTFYLSENLLESIPLNILTHLENLSNFALEGNYDLLVPDQNTIDKGSESILNFLRSQP